MLSGILIFGIAFVVPAANSLISFNRRPQLEGRVYTIAAIYAVAAIRAISRLQQAAAETAAGRAEGRSATPPSTRRCPNRCNLPSCRSGR